MGLQGEFSIVQTLKHQAKKFLTRKKDCGPQGRARPQAAANDAPQSGASFFCRNARAVRYIEKAKKAPLEQVCFGFAALEPAPRHRPAPVQGPSGGLTAPSRASSGGPAGRAFLKKAWEDWQLIGFCPEMPCLGHVRENPCQKSCARMPQDGSEIVWQVTDTPPSSVPSRAVPAPVPHNSAAWTGSIGKSVVLRYCRASPPTVFQEPPTNVLSRAATHSSDTSNRIRPTCACLPVRGLARTPPIT
jgi:hypothetical protein